MDGLPYRLPLLLGGAAPTGLFPVSGIPGGECMEQWAAEHPEALQNSLNQWLNAGAHAIFAPTFGANSARLAAFGLEQQTEAFNHTLANAAKQIAAKHRALTGATLAPTGNFVPPAGTADFDDLFDLYREQIRALEAADIDFLAVAQQTSLADMRAAVLAARNTDLPVFVTLRVDKTGQTSAGVTLLSALITLQAMGAAAVGLSGALLPEEMLPFIEEASAHTSVPIIAKPAAQHPGEPALTPQEFAAQMRELMKAGARIVGGAEGTTPEHIAALAPIVQEFAPPIFAEEPDSYAAAIESEAFFLGEDLEFSRPLICDSGLGDDFIDLEDERINVALVRIDSIDDARILAENSTMARLPIAVQCTSKPVLDAALRYFQGRLIVDSRSPLEEETIAPMCKKYGAILY